MVEIGGILGDDMTEKILLEFFPQIILEIPESPGGSCCLKPVVTQSKESRRMYLFAQHIRWKYKDRIDLEIPSKSISRILFVKKYRQLKADLRLKRLKIKRLPAIVLANQVLCEGQMNNVEELEKIADLIMNKLENN
jgi:hypothetical protein